MFRIHPHCYEVGDQVYVRSQHWPSQAREATTLNGYGDQPFLVEQQTYNGKGWPHYVLRDTIGKTWLVSQLELSSVPFSNFKRS